jgi:regulatory protein
MQVDEFLARLKTTKSDDEPSLDEASLDGKNQAARLAREIRSKALFLLARREHSFQELESKLGRSFSDKSMVLEQLQALADEGLQSDQRYAEIAVRSALTKFHGLVRIKNQLRSNGIPAALIEKTVVEADVNWVEQLKRLSLRKYGDTPCEDMKEKAKRMRFFQYRGYSLSDIYAVLDED